MIKHSAVIARETAIKIKDLAESNRKREEEVKRKAAFDEVNDAIDSAIGGGRTDITLSHRINQYVKDDLILAGYKVEDIEAEEDGWPMTKISF